MKKLRLELDDLQVESFAAEIDGEAGTVKATTKPSPRSAR